MIEVLLAFASGWLGRSIVRHLEGRRANELEAENRQLRACLRYVRGVMSHQATLPSVARYIDRVLGDEAGS